ncbi:hypothetical protein AS850_09820 [Frondihabitans sp. 762G35]|nr:hypothetical protein AS850_09820 [Frondihabitans sp. 762G35]
MGEYPSPVRTHSPEDPVEPVLVSLLRPFAPLRFLSVRSAFAGVPRPNDEPRALVAGPDPLKLLLLGTDAATGWGVRSHALALPGQLARELGAATGRGVTVDLVTRPGIRLSGLSELVAGRDLRGYDAVLVVGGLYDAALLVRERTWRLEMGDLLARLSNATLESTPIVVTGLAPVSSLAGSPQPGQRTWDDWASRLDSVTADLCAVSANAHHLPMAEAVGEVTELNQPDRFRSPAQYRCLARRKARCLAELLEPTGRRSIAGVSRGEPEALAVP